MSAAAITEAQRRDLALAAAAVTVVVEVAHFVARGLPAIPVGVINLSPSVVPAFGLLVVGGASLLGRARSDDGAKTFWALLAVVLTLTSTAIIRVDQLPSLVGLVLAAVNEELVYRLAGPALIAYGLLRLGMRLRGAQVIGYLVAGTAFVLLPGHTAQWTSAADALPFVAYTVLATLAVHRSGALLEVGLLHGTMNLINLGRISGLVGATGSVLVAAMVAILVLAYLPASAPRRPLDAPNPGVDPADVDTLVLLAPALV